MKKLLCILLIAVCAVSLPSCDRNRMDEEISGEVFSDLESVAMAVEDMYARLKYYTVFSNYMIRMGDMRADLLVPCQGNDVVYSYEYSPTKDSFFTMWHEFYDTIVKANNIIRSVEGLEVSAQKENRKRDYLGQAYAVRAFCYFNLVRLYGRPYKFDNGASLGAVLIQEPLSPSETRLPRNTVAETYNQIENDIAVAQSFLAKEINPGHFNYWAARFLEAKVALYKAEYEQAYSVAKDLINNGPYSLIPRDKYLASWSDEGNEESVFEGVMGYQLSNDQEYVMGSSFYCWLWFGYSNSGGTVVPTKTWIDLFATTPNDIRKQWIAYDDPFTGIRQTGEYWLKKFIGNRNSFPTVNNPRYMRLAEAYLIAAEAGMMTGKSDAASLLLAVAQRADPDVTTIDATMENIEIQRMKELIGEGDRFFDLMRRNGTYFKNDPHNPFNVALCWYDDKVMLPIAEEERILYPELEQNPGYHH